MEIEYQAVCTHANVKDDHIDFCVGIDEGDEKAQKFIEAASDPATKGLVSLWIHFKIINLPRDHIDLNKWHDGRVDIEAKPVLDAMRAEFEAAIKEIDAITYVSE